MLWLFAVGMLGNLIYVSVEFILPRIFSGANANSFDQKLVNNPVQSKLTPLAFVPQQFRSGRARIRMNKHLFH